MQPNQQQPSVPSSKATAPLYLALLLSLILVQETCSSRAQHVCPNKCGRRPCIDLYGTEIINAVSNRNQMGMRLELWVILSHFVINRMHAWQPKLKMVQNWSRMNGDRAYKTGWLTHNGNQSPFFALIHSVSVSILISSLQSICRRRRL